MNRKNSALDWSMASAICGKSSTTPDWLVRAPFAVAFVLAILAGQSTQAQSLKAASPGHKPATVTVDSQAGPWLPSLNPAYDYGTHDNGSPAIVNHQNSGIEIIPGQLLTITYLSGLVSAGPGWPFTDANGDVSGPYGCGDGLLDHGSSGKAFPCVYTDLSKKTYLVELMGVFTDSNGVIVGQPFTVGDGPSQVAIPAGAKQLQMGLNDDIFHDNQGSFTVQIAGGCNDRWGNNCPFVMPSDGYLYLQQMGGEAGGVTTFGIGTSTNDFVPYYTGLPNNPDPTGEVLVGHFSAGTTIHFGMYTTFGGDAGWAFSVDNDVPSIEAFTDIHDSLGMGGSVIEQTGQDTWLLHLDDALSYLYGDDNNDVLMQLRISATQSSKGTCNLHSGNNCPFVMPFDGTLYLQQMGGESAGTTTFGIGTSQNDFVPYYTGLPNDPYPTGEVQVGFFAAGTTIHLGMYTTGLGNAGWAFSVDNDFPSVVSFTDIRDLLGMGGSVIEQTGQNTWLLHLDDALSYLYDDDNNDVLMQLRIAP